MKWTHLLSAQHLAICDPRIFQEYIVDFTMAPKVTQSLDATQNALVGILVDGDRDKFRLTSANDRGHDEHDLCEV